MQDNFSTEFAPTKISPPGTLNSNLQFFVKREDLHPLGSHKHHAAKQQIEWVKKNNPKGGVLTTSGNAGICAGYFAKQMNIPLYVLTGPGNQRAKLEKLSEHCNNLYISEKSARLCNYISAKYELHNLRPSIDDLAVKGFENLGKEIFTQYEEMKLHGILTNFWKEIFIFSTSGASYVGIYQALQKLHDEGKLSDLPKLHTVRGAAGSRGVAHSSRTNTINTILKKTNGTLINIDKQELHEFQQKFPDIQLSRESLSALAAALKNNADTNSLVISTGKKWGLENQNFDTSQIPTLETLQDCNRLFS